MCHEPGYLLSGLFLRDESHVWSLNPATDEPWFVRWHVSVAPQVLDNDRYGGTLCSEIMPRVMSKDLETFRKTWPA